MTQTERLRALLDSGRVRWMPGMLATRETGPCTGTYRYSDEAIRQNVCFVGGVPDLDDPATIGCLVAQLREALGDEALHVRGMKPYQPRMAGSHNTAQWFVCDAHGRRLYRGATEAEAILAAFEALLSAS